MYSSQTAKTCRACGQETLTTVLNLVDMPPGDKYEEELSNIPQTLISSSIDRCKNCNHIQMSGSAEPDYIYGNYLSRPASTNPRLKELYLLYCKEIASLAAGGSVIEVGSNDGLFLELFKELGIKSIGIEPAKNLVKFANERGVETVQGYVSEENIDKAINKVGKPSVILANHCFSNVEDIQEWAKAISNGLRDDGYLVLQTFYQKSVLENFLLENYNHEHLSYVLIGPIRDFFAKYGLILHKCKFIDAKGGSIRLYFKKNNQEPKYDQETIKLLEEELLFLSNIDQHFLNTEEYIKRTSLSIKSIIGESSSSSVAAYGTSIGATVFTYQFGLTNNIKVFFDDDQLRQGRFSPGIGAPVIAGRSKELLEYKNCLMFAPLYAKQIAKANLNYLKNGGRFIIIRPEVKLITLSDLDADGNITL